MPAAEPLDNTFDLAEIVRGLASDMEALRSGKMTIEQARAQADLAKQCFNGMRLVITARKYLEGSMKQIPEAAQ